MEHRTLLELLNRHAAERPDTVACRFLAEGEAETFRVTYAELRADVDRFAGALRARCAPGSRIALVCSQSPLFLTAFLGVLRARCVAVPLPPPTSAGASAAGLDAQLRDARPALLVTDFPVRRIEEWLASPPPLATAADLLSGAADPDAAEQPGPEPGDLAFLQYTSGSTGAPKGVMITHAALLANQRQIHRAFGQNEQSVLVSWLPFYHDMGLIGMLLHPVYLGATSVLMPAEAFLRKPVRWLRALSDHRGTISGAPDFAFALCARRVTEAEAADLDLSAWQVACCGSEPVRRTTVDDFTGRFAAAGFRPDSFRPSYGLAEATLLVSAADSGAPRIAAVPGAGQPAGADVVSCGVPRAEDVAVVDGDRRLPDGEVGEIWVSGPNVAAGYWGQPDATAEVFGARLDGSRDSDRRYLRTGDLGFLQDGELFVTGRIKDIVIVRGRNHHPQDIEATVQEQHPALRGAAGAAFTVEGELVVVQAARGRLPDAAALAGTIRTAVLREHGLATAEVVLVRPAGVTKTTSGKVRRAHCREEYLAGALPVVHRDGTPPGGTVPGADTGSGTALEARSGQRPVRIDPEALAATVAEILDRPAADLRPDVPLSALGVDSLSALWIQQEISDRFGLDVPAEHLIDGSTLGDLAALGTDAVPPPVLPAPGPAELSRGQHALWFLSRLNDSGAAYVLHRAVDLLTDVDDAVLSAAVHRLVARHAQLRTRFVEEGGRVSRAEWSPQDHRWFRSVTVAGEAEVERGVRAEAARPLDLCRDALFRVVVHRAPGRPAVLLIVASHTIADLFSFSVILRELGVLCGPGGATALGRAADTGPFLAAERALLASPDGDRMLDELARSIADAPPLPLPRDREPGTGARFGGDCVVLEFGAGDRQRVRDLADALGCTPFAVLLAAFHGFLDRITGESDMVIGTPVALRSRPELREAVGYLINMVPIRVTGGPDDSLADRVRRARTPAAHAVARAAVPLSSLVQRLGPSRDPSASAVFDVTCGYHEDLADAEGLTGLSLEVEGAEAVFGPLRMRAHPLPLRTSVTDIDVTFGFAGDTLAMRFNYGTDAFAPDTARSLAESLRAFASAALADCDAPLRELPLSEGESGIARPGPLEVEPRPLGTLVEAAIAEHADEPAIVHAESTWTYADLGAWSADLAADLVARLPRAADRPAGETARTPVVALFLDSGPEFMAGMTAALRAGFGFMPLLPDLPDQRLEFMLADSDPVAVFVPPADADRLRALAKAAGVEPAVVPITRREPGQGGTAGPPVPASAPDPESIAYVVYTSGTTGNPKGVVIPHRSVLPLLLWQRREFGAGPGMRMAQTCSLSFDVGLQELLTVLLFGGAICVPRHAERFSARAYGDFLARDRANALYATPTFVRDLVANAVPMPSIMTVQIAGELLTATVVEGVRRLFGPGCRIYNGYGPTETGINCAMHLTAPPAPDAPDTLPVGRPTGLARLYVLDRHRLPMPRGVLGEVYIGGPGVGLGYLNRDEENRARFLPDTVDLPGGRMYRTGDRGRLTTDGDLVIAGRIDDQVKIRGYRIEPGEVAVALRAAPGVSDCAVVVDRSGTVPRLVAGVTGQDLDVPGLYRELGRRLPAYMMPAQIVVLGRLPRTHNGKLDAARLREQAARAAPLAHAGTDDRYLPVVIEVWGEVLDRSVPADANFFDLGGSSLAIGRVVLRLKEETGIEVPMHHVFQFPTARSLAASLDVLHGPAAARSASRKPLAAARRVRGRQQRA